ncbi:MAG: 23S rRNA (guanosine(2251)-2'-O)-methyltransferase RlmB [Chitinophagales bacterium]
MANQYFCIFGRKPVIEAITAGKRFDKILMLKGATGDEVKTIQNLARQTETPIQSVPKEKLESVVRKYSKYKEANHQGVLGFLSMVDYYAIDDVLNNSLSKGKNPLFVVLDGVTDVGNFGAIARSAECLGADAVVIPAQGAAQINAEAMKASAGALNKIFVCREKSLFTAVKFLKASGVRVYGADMKGSDVGKVEWNVPTAIILGSEGYGISTELLKLCDETISIPMSGTIESLNVSVSAGIILYEAARHRK